MPVTPALRRLRSPAGRAAIARELATIVGRFADPYASQGERYVVTVDEFAGEVFELGRPYRSTRFFPRHALKRNLDAYRGFMAFAQGQDTTDWRFWNVGIPNHKASVYSLTTELERFNKVLNQELSHLRKTKAMEVLLIGIHLRYDHSTDAFDLHAHIICRVPKGKRDLASSHLFRKFSKTETKDQQIHNLEAAVTYLLWGILDPEAMLDWPEAAVQAAWEVTTAKARLMRTGGSFALWRRAQRAATTDLAARDARRRKAQNRAETGYAPATLFSGDKVLGRMRMTLSGSLRDGVLLERACPVAQAEAVPQSADASPLRDTGYPSATVATTQESLVGTAVPASPSTPSEAMLASGVGPAPSSVPGIRPRRPQSWWWRAWPYGGERWPLRPPAPIHRRLSGCQAGLVDIRRAQAIAQRRNRLSSTPESKDVG